MLAGILRRRRGAARRRLKYAVFGAGAAGVMLYGISLLAGVLGSAHLPTMAARLADLLAGDRGRDRAVVLVLGGLMLMVGLAFKLSAVPFHFWAPDVFEGRRPKWPRSCPSPPRPPPWDCWPGWPCLRRRAGRGPGAPWPGAALSSAGLVALLAAVTCTFGNLAAYGQTNMKRLLAYSTIAHAGYMMMPVAAAVALAGTTWPRAVRRGRTGHLRGHLPVHEFRGVRRGGLRAQRHPERRDCRLRRPGPPLARAGRVHGDHPLQPGGPAAAGRFSGQVAVFAALVDAQPAGSCWPSAALNTVLSLFYYLRVVKVMILSRARRPGAGHPLVSLPGLYTAAARRECCWSCSCGGAACSSGRRGRYRVFEMRG